MNSWRTTTAGVCTIIAAIASVIAALLDGNASTNPDFTTVVPAIAAGIGLLVARDSKAKEKKENP